MKTALLALCLLGFLLVGCTTTWIPTTYEGTVSAIEITPLGEVATNIGKVYFNDGRAITFLDVPQLEIGRHYVITANVPKNGTAGGRITSVKITP